MGKEFVLARKRHYIQVFEMGVIKIGREIFGYRAPKEKKITYYEVDLYNNSEKFIKTIKKKGGKGITPAKIAKDLFAKNKRYGMIIVQNLSNGRVKHFDR